MVQIVPDLIPPTPKTTIYYTSSNPRPSPQMIGAMAYVQAKIIRGEGKVKVTEIGNQYKWLAQVPLSQKDWDFHPILVGIEEVWITSRWLAKGRG